MANGKKTNVGQLKGYEKNPRTITEEKKRILAKGLEHYGDLSGIVFNVKKGELVGGHQRTSLFDSEDQINYLEKYPQPDDQGTVALGYIEHNGKKYSYREVEWSDEDHAAACLLANQSGGDWDWSLVKELTLSLKEGMFDLDLTGFELPQIDELVLMDPKDIIAELGTTTFIKESDLQNNQSELVHIEKLKPHPKNYRKHPEDQLKHLKESIREFGIYKNIVVANDYTILTGHALYEAATQMGIRLIPVRKKNFDPNSTQALKILTNDNELGHFAEVDDRLLSEILKEIKEFDPSGLLGTGYDEMMLANLLMVTRPKSEINDINEAADWVGLPSFEPPEDKWKLIISFGDETSRRDFLNFMGAKSVNKIQGRTASLNWPETERDDLKSVRFESREAELNV